MNIYTVRFFGYRFPEYGAEIENRLDKLLYKLITQQEYVNFLIGLGGDFDLLASFAIPCLHKKARCFTQRNL